MPTHPPQRRVRPALSDQHAIVTVWTCSINDWIHTLRSENAGNDFCIHLQSYANYFSGEVVCSQKMTPNKTKTTKRRSWRATIEKRFEQRSIEFHSKSQPRKPTNLNSNQMIPRPKFPFHISLDGALELTQAREAGIRSRLLLGI